MNDDTPEFQRVLVMGTSHVTRNDSTLLDAMAARERERGVEKLMIAEYYGGWLIRIFDEMGSITPALRDAGFSNEFTTLLRFAEQQKCEWLRLDCDGLVYDNFPTFDW